MTEPIYRNSLKPGHRLHWYSIEKVLGQGGFGITYLAHDFNLDHEVAIKEYLPIELAVREQDSSVQPASDTHGARFKWGLDRFMAEAQTLARFKHPNIVRVLAVFEANGTGYMVMEYEHGDTLHEILTRRQTLEEEELLNIVLPILGGLEKVHERGFIHRDIKPANIFIRDDGSPVLIDFGSARQALGAELTTLVSPGYAPFEQYYSKGEQQGPWTDIYGLGATLYRAVTGRPPQDALDRSRAILEAGRDTLVDVGEIGRGRYSARFLKAIDHALQFRPKDRPQTVAEWRREFGVLPDSRPNVKALDSAMMAATIAADEPRSAPILTAAPSVARRAVPKVQAADSGMAPKIIADGPRSESNPPAPPSSVWRTGPHVQAADSGLAAKVVADEPRSEPVPPFSAPSVVRRKGLALALVATAVVVAAAFWASVTTPILDGDNTRMVFGTGTFEFKWPGGDVWNVFRGDKEVAVHYGSDKQALQAGTYTIKPQGNKAVFEPFNVTIENGLTNTVAMGGVFEFKWPGGDVWNVFRGDKEVAVHYGSDKQALQAGTYTIKPQGNKAVFEPFNVTIENGVTTTAP